MWTRSLVAMHDSLQGSVHVNPAICWWCSRWDESLENDVWRRRALGTVCEPLRDLPVVSRSSCSSRWTRWSRWFSPKA